MRAAWHGIRLLSGALLGLVSLGGCRPSAAAVQAVQPPPTAIATEPARASPTPAVGGHQETETPLKVTGQAPAIPAGSNDVIYVSQPGDSFRAIAGRFGLFPLDLRCKQTLEPYCPDEGEGQEAAPGFAPDLLLPAGTGIILPGGEEFPAPSARLLPDSEVVFSAAASGFDTLAFIDQAGGFLSGYRQYLMMNAWNSGADIVLLVALENSINPRLLIALLEYQCGCVLGRNDFDGPFMGAAFHKRHDLYGQLVWAVHELSEGYYGWRAGTLTEVILADGAVVRLNPYLNAGTAALFRLFAPLYGERDFQEVVDPETGFLSLYESMFGDPWKRELAIYPDGSAQPELALPFEKGSTWSFTGGPHPAFEGNGPLAALDFAPASAAPGCEPASTWVLASADGLVVRTGYGVVIQDLDGDGDEHTGWVIMYLHIAAASSVETGTYLNAGERVGLPSCEGGRANGTHLHIARLLNGEWIAAGSGPLVFNLGGWLAQDGAEAYKGRLARGGEVLEACTCSWRKGWITGE